jgi:HlyD family secretion protein
MSIAPTDAAAASTLPRRRMKRRRTVGDVITQFVLPIVALSLLAFAGWYVWSTRRVPRDPPPPIQPARSPFSDAVAAAGVVEAQTENIAVGSATPGVVVQVDVKVGDDVTPGTPLFRLDDRDLLAELAVRRVARETDALKRAEDTFARKVTTEQELIARREALAAAQANLERTEADLNLLKAGAWEYDRDIARAGVGRAEAEAAKIETELDRLIVRALVAGQVLQVNVRPGDSVGAPPGQPLIVLGNIEKLHVRVDIDEFDIARFTETAKATAVPRGSLQERYPLEFVRVEPFVVPKKSLTGDNTERVDTRVLQVIYSCDPSGRPPLFVGQQVEVYLEAAPASAAGF